MIDNADGFFDGLPPGPLKKRMGIVFKEAEEVQLERQLILYEKRLAKNKRRLQELKRKRDSDEEEVSSSDSDVDGKDKEISILSEHLNISSPPKQKKLGNKGCLLYTSPSPRDA